MPAGGGFCGEPLDRDLGIPSLASAKATGDPAGTMPCSPYSVSQSRSIDIPTNAAHFAASWKDGLRLPSSTIDRNDTEQPTPRAMIPNDLMSRPSPVGNVRGAFGSALRRFVGAALRFMCGDGRATRVD